MKDTKHQTIALILLFSALLLWLYIAVGPEMGSADINETAILNTTVNITNAAPEVRLVTMPDEINLNAYGNVTVECNVSTYDYDNNTAGVNITLHYYLNGSLEPPDNNVVYKNTSCSALTVFNYAMNWTCTVDMAYWANNGTWYCNATAYDDDGAESNNRSDPGIVNPLVAIYVPGILNYGDLQYLETSEAKTANITNAGNRRVNISIEGWGSTVGDNLAMNCSYGYIPIEYEKYYASNETYSNMIPLSITTTMLNSYYVDHRFDETQESINSTWWRLQIPPFAGGICSGKILFTGTDYVGG